MDQIPLSENLGTSRPPVRISRDEMNLAEFPLTVLSTRADTSVKTLEFKDSIQGRNGELVERSWIITGADKFGLPTASDDEVLLGLLKLTVDDGFKDRKVYFTRYELLRILRWTTEGRSYQRLQRALDRLTGVKIKATNAFYDNVTKSHSTRHFGIVDAYEINDGRNTAPKPSFFSWSDVIFSSFKVGFIKKLDLDFYLDLKSAVSKRLYRYLDKHFWYKSIVKINLFVLAHEKLGISRNYKFASSLRQQLDPALDELKAMGFVGGYEYEGRGQETFVHIAAASTRPRSKQSGEGVRRGPEPSDEEGQGRDLKSLVGQLLLARGIKESQLEKLVYHRTEDALQRIREIVSYFDQLVGSNSRLISKSPVGFLYRAVEHPEQFVLPGEQPSKRSQTAMLFSQPVSSRLGTHDEAGAQAVSLENRKQAAASSLEAEYLIARRREVARLRSETEAEVLAKIELEVEAALSKIRKSLSEARFKEVVTHGVDERLIRLFAFPEFEEWVKDRK